MPRSLPTTPSNQGYYTGTLTNKAYAIEVTDNGTMAWMAENMSKLAMATPAQLSYMQKYIAETLAKELKERSPVGRNSSNWHEDPRFLGPLAESYGVKQSGGNYEVTTTELLKFRVQSEGAAAAARLVRPIPIAGSEYARVSWSRQGQPRIALWWPQLGVGHTLSSVSGHPVPKQSFYDDAWQYVMGKYAQNLLDPAVFNAVRIITGEAAPTYNDAGRIESPWGRTYKTMRGFKSGLTWYKKRTGQA